MLLGHNNQMVWKIISDVRQDMMNPESYDQAILYRNLHNALLEVLQGKAEFPITFEIPDSLVEGDNDG